MEFTAHYVACQIRDNVALLGFADDQSNTTQYVLLQRDLEPSHQDRELGHDNFHIEINGQQYSGYGGIASARLQGSRLVLQLDPQTAADISVDNVIEITLLVPMEQLKELIKQLRLLLGDKCFLVIRLCKPKPACKSPVFLL